MAVAGVARDCSFLSMRGFTVATCPSLSLCGRGGGWNVYGSSCRAELINLNPACSTIRLSSTHQLQFAWKYQSALCAMVPPIVGLPQPPAGGCGGTGEQRPCRSADLFFLFHCLVLPFYHVAICFCSSRSTFCLLPTIPPATDTRIDMPSPCDIVGSFLPSSTITCMCE